MHVAKINLMSELDISSNNSVNNDVRVTKQKQYMDMYTAMSIVDYNIIHTTNIKIIYIMHGCIWDKYEVVRYN